MHGLDVRVRQLLGCLLSPTGQAGYGLRRTLRRQSGLQQGEWLDGWLGLWCSPVRWEDVCVPHVLMRCSEVAIPLPRLFEARGASNVCTLFVCCVYAHFPNPCVLGVVASWEERRFPCCVSLSKSMDTSIWSAVSRNVGCPNELFS